MLNNEHVVIETNCGTTPCSPRNMQGQSGRQKLGDSNTVFHTAWNLASFLLYVLQTYLLGMRKACGIGLLYRNYRCLLEETRWLGCWLIYVCLETRWLGQKTWFLSPGPVLSVVTGRLTAASAGVVRSLYRIRWGGGRWRGERGGG